MEAIDFNRYGSRVRTAGPLPASEVKLYPAWMHRPAVVRLMEYFRMNQGKGMFLYRDADGYRLRFNPGITGADVGDERWTVAINLYDLLRDAVADLNDLIAQGESIPYLRRGGQ